MNPNDPRRIDIRPSSAPPEATELDASWDDETVPGFVLDDPLNEFDRVTAIPELPSDLYVQRVMDSVDDSRAPAGRGTDSSAPYPAVSLHDAPTARPAVPATLSPGLPPFSPSSAGLELMDLSFDSISSLKVAQRVDPQARDREHPARELSLAEEPTAGPVHATEPNPLGTLKDRYAMGDFSGALVIAEGILKSNPEDLEAPRYAQSCRDVLTQMYSARLGSLDQVVSIALPGDRIRWLTLDHRAGFLLSLVDGVSTLDQILDISGMTRLDALRIMFQLLDQRVIALG